MKLNRYAVTANKPCHFISHYSLDNLILNPSHILGHFFWLADFASFLKTVNKPISQPTRLAFNPYLQLPFLRSCNACFTIYLWHTKLLSIRLELFISPKLVLKMSSIFNDSYRFISELMDVFLMAGVHQQTDQSNYLAEGQNLNL